MEAQHISIQKDPQMFFPDSFSPFLGSLKVEPNPAV